MTDVCAVTQSSGLGLPEVVVHPVPRAQHVVNVRAHALRWYGVFVGGVKGGGVQVSSWVEAQVQA